MENPVYIRTEITTDLNSSYKDESENRNENDNDSNSDNDGQYQDVDNMYNEYDYMEVQ